MGKDMRGYVDFRIINQSISMQQILDYYSIDWLRPSGNESIGRCPIHEGEGTRTFHLNLTKNVFNCFSCGAKGGSVIDFVAAKEKCSIRQAALKLKAWFGISGDVRVKTVRQPPRRTPQVQKPAFINPPLSFKLRIDSGHPYGLRRGLTRETIDSFGTGLCLSRGVFAGRYVVPLHDSIGLRVGYAGRSVDGSEPKYLFPSGKRGFRKSQLLFGLHRIINQSKPSDGVVLVEGFFSCMRLQQAGWACVSILGSSLSKPQEELLLRHFREAVLFFDGDQAGRRATKNCSERLGQRILVKTITLPERKQPDMLSGEEVRDLLA